MFPVSATERCALWQRCPVLGRVVSIVVLWLGIGAIAGATDPIPVAAVKLPAPNHNAFATTARYDSQGILYAWDGFGVWRQNGINVNAFTQIGTVIGGSNEPTGWYGSAGGAYNTADAGPINFSCDSERILLGNGAGGWGSLNVPPQSELNGLIWAMPMSGSTVSLPNGDTPIATIAYHTDFIPLPVASTIGNKTTKYFVNQGVSGYESDPHSSILVLDETTGLAAPVITNGPWGHHVVSVQPSGPTIVCRRGLRHRSGQDLLFRAGSTRLCVSGWQAAGLHDGRPAF